MGQFPYSVDNKAVNCRLFGEWSWQASVRDVCNKVVSRHYITMGIPTHIKMVYVETDSLWGSK